jgi:Protein of unknown function (DUF1524)
VSALRRDALRRLALHRLALHRDAVRRRVALPVLAGIVVALAGCNPVSAPGATSSVAPTTNPTIARQQLDELTVGASRSMAGYSRERFPHWTQHENGCSTRELVLKRDGTGVKTGSGCKVTSGRWVSPYDGKATTDAESLDIDHMVPLANAWRSGADSWTDDQRSQFANDLTRPQLFAVTASVNRAKGDQDPSQWRPPNREYWCQYAQDWILVKRSWNLTATLTEKVALTDMLGTCT